MSEFTDRMEAGAEQLAKLMESESRKSGTVPDWDAVPNPGDAPDLTNVKPWYNPPSAFNRDANRILIGINPGGNPAHGEGPSHECKDSDWDDETYNEWVCARWRKNGRVISTHQDNILDVFNALYGTVHGKRKLVETPSTNVCPLRAEDPEYIPDTVWYASENWLLALLEHLQPKTIICNGNSVSGKRPIKSPWSTIVSKARQGEYTLELRPEVEVARRRNLRHGVVRGGKFDGAQVIGIPQGIRGSRDKLHAKLRELSNRYDIL